MSDSGNWMLVPFVGVAIVIGAVAVPVMLIKGLVEATSESLGAGFQSMADNGKKKIAAHEKHTYLAKYSLESIAGSLDKNKITGLNASIGRDCSDNAQCSMKELNSCLDKKGVPTFSIAQDNKNGLLVPRVYEGLGSQIQIGSNVKFERAYGFYYLSPSGNLEAKVGDKELVAETFSCRSFECDKVIESHRSQGVLYNRRSNQNVHNYAYIIKTNLPQFAYRKDLTSMTKSPLGIIDESIGKYATISLHPISKAFHVNINGIIALNRPQDGYPEYPMDLPPRTAETYLSKFVCLPEGDRSTVPFQRIISSSGNVTL